MVSAQDWAIVEVCSGLICASLLHLKPLITTFASSFVQTSQAVMSRVRPSRSWASGRVDDKVTTIPQQNHPSYTATLAMCAASSEDAVQRYEREIVREDVKTSEIYPEILPTPDKVLIWYKRNSWNEKESSIMFPHSYV